MKVMYKTLGFKVPDHYDDAEFELMLAAWLWGQGLPEDVEHVEPNYPDPGYGVMRGNNTLDEDDE